MGLLRVAVIFPHIVYYGYCPAKFQKKAVCAALHD